MKNIVGSLSFELCVESLQAARSAELGGANSIELCSRLECGGVTPSPALMIATIAAVSVPVSVLVRPREGDFDFTAAEFEEMRRQIEAAGEAGASSVALGVLHQDGRVDVERTRMLVELARPMTVTFHRAFDEAVDARQTLGASQALEDVIETGADSLLTSGGASDVLTGADAIGALVKQAGHRIRIIAGGGLRLDNLLEVVRRSGVFSVHGSLTRESHGGNASNPRALERSVREALRLLREGHREQAFATPEP